MLKFSPKHISHKGKIDNGTIGKCHIEVYHGSYRIGLSLKNKKYYITIGRVCEITFYRAIHICNLINEDIVKGQFDFTKKRYIVTNTENIIENENIKQAWERYKNVSKKIIAETTQKKDWVTIDRFLEKFTEKELSFDNIKSFANICLKYYSIGTLHTIFRRLNPAINLHYETERIDYLVKQLPKLQKKRIEFFTPEEIKIILKTFKNNKSYYYSYIAFSAFTGCRPEETIALTWDDIIWSNDKETCQIKINKAYTNGILRQKTKNSKIRVIPCSKMLIKLFLEEIPVIENPNNLIFPSLKLGYINHNNFHNKEWIPTIKYLVKQKLIKKYLRFYTLRHSFATNLLRTGIDIATVAGLLGDNIQTVIKHYIGNDYENVNLPDIY